MKLYQLFDELQGREPDVTQPLRELSRGPLALVSFVKPPLPNPIVLDPFRGTPSVPLVQPTQYVPNPPYVDKSDPEAVDFELHF